MYDESAAFVINCKVRSLRVQVLSFFFSFSLSFRAPTRSAFPLPAAQRRWNCAHARSSLERGLPRSLEPRASLLAQALPATHSIRPPLNCLGGCIQHWELDTRRLLKKTFFITLSAEEHNAGHDVFFFFAPEKERVHHALALLKTKY